MLIQINHPETLSMLMERFQRTDFPVSFEMIDLFVTFILDEKILKQTGFRNIKFYLPLPGYNSPKHIIVYEHLEGLKFVVAHILGGLGLKRKILKKIIRFPFVARFWRSMFFSFDMFAQKL